MAEVNEISGTLSQLQSFLLREEMMDTTRSSMLQVDHIIKILSKCVITFSELENILDELELKSMGILDRMRWTWKETDIMLLIQRLQHHKVSLSLMLNVINGFVASYSFGWIY